MSALKVDFVRFEKLTKEERDKHCAKDDSTYLRVQYNDKTILLKSDIMEPEDACFNRDLKWVDGAIKLAYELGFQDGQKETKT